ncbi:MAG TPA: dienelactone hydrolase family protein [Tepidiformaceae bacterium]|nr:dienelactone hydrolase family protein [Tepidiformaceae bacterium]
MPGNMWDMGPEEDDEQDEDLTLQLTRVSASPTDDPKVFKVHLESTRGTIEGILHPVEGGTGAVICVGGAMGGFDGPADSLYPRLAGLLAPKGVTTLRIEYRQPNNFEECVIDVMAGCSFMQGIGAEDLVLLGHSFGAAVVIKAGELFPRVRGVAAMSPQLHGTRQVQQLGRPLLLIHGTSDSILDSEASEDIYRRAQDPKRIVLFSDTGHSLVQAKAQIDALLTEWIPQRLNDDPMQSGRSECIADGA